MILLIHRPGKKFIICISCKVLIKVLQPLINITIRTYWNIWRHAIAKFTLRKKIKKCLFFTRFITQNRNFVFLWSGVMMTFSSMIMLGISEIRVISFVTVPCMFKDLQLKHILLHLHFPYYFCSFPGHLK